MTTIFTVPPLLKEVRITMLDPLISLIAPHACLSCGRLGRLLCEPCTNDMIQSRESTCIGCGMTNAVGLCYSCTSQWPVERAFVFGERAGVIKTLIDEYKYSYRRAGSRDLARLVAAMIPHGTEGVVIPIPTIAASVRRRGFDHAVLLARGFARRCSLTYAPLLTRSGVTVQHGATKRQRIIQAKSAFTLRRPIDLQTLYIIIDDIVTTGASLQAAAKALRDGGATRIWVVAIARQPLDFPLDAKE